MRCYAEHKPAVSLIHAQLDDADARAAATTAAHALRAGEANNSNNNTHRQRNPGTGRNEKKGGGVYKNPGQSPLRNSASAIATFISLSFITFLTVSAGRENPNCRGKNNGGKP